MFVFRRVLSLRTAFFAMALAAAAQVTSAPNLDSKDQPLVFKSKVNLIMVPVVVRDKKGNAIATLHQEDFQLFDNGKPQVISSFSVESLAAKAIPPIPPVGKTKAAQPAEPSAVTPDRQSLKPTVSSGIEVNGQAKGPALRPAVSDHLPSHPTLADKTTILRSRRTDCAMVMPRESLADKRIRPSAGTKTMRELIAYNALGVI